MRWRRREVVVVFLLVLPVVALCVTQAEQSLLQDRIPAVPESQRETQNLVPVADAGQSVFAPPICPAASHVVRQVVPGVSICGVVLAHRSPLPFADVRTP